MHTTLFSYPHLVFLVRVGPSIQKELHYLVVAIGAGLQQCCLTNLYHSIDQKTIKLFLKTY